MARAVQCQEAMAHTKAITTVDMADDTIAVLAGNADGARWEIYTVADGLESFSHYAMAGEARQLADRAYGADVVAFASNDPRDARHFGLVA